MSKNILAALLLCPLCLGGCETLVLQIIPCHVTKTPPKPPVSEAESRREGYRYLGAGLAALVTGLAVNAEAERARGEEQAVGKALIFPVAMVGGFVGYLVVAAAQSIFGLDGGESPGQAVAEAPPPDAEIKALRDILAAKGPSRALYERLADIHERKGQLEEALAACKRAESLGPSDANLAQRRARLEARIRASTFPFLPQ